MGQRIKRSQRIGLSLLLPRDGGVLHFPLCYDQDHRRFPHSAKDISGRESSLNSLTLSLAETGPTSDCATGERSPSESSRACSLFFGFLR